VRGLREPETFDVLGFTRISAKQRDGRLMLLRQAAAKRMRAKLLEIKGQQVARDVLATRPSPRKQPTKGRPPSAPPTSECTKGLVPG
jgi:hypothetical protein